MPGIVFSEDDKRVVAIHSFYDASDIRLVFASFTAYQMRLTRMRDDGQPETFTIDARDMDALTEAWLAFRADQTAKFEAIQKKNEDARIAEEKRMEAVKEEAYSLAYKHSIVIEKLNFGAYQLLLPDGERTKSIQTFDGVLRAIMTVIEHMKKETARMLEEHTQVL